MNQFNNILYVSTGIDDETDSLKQALSIADNNKSVLTALMIYPALPGTLVEYRDKWEESLAGQFRQSVEAAFATLSRTGPCPPVTVLFDSDDMPAVRIIRQVLRNGHDLVIKEAEASGSGRGFKALDTELLRQCPCPVWLSRPIAHSRGDIRVAVAIDPDGVNLAAADLGLRLLRLSSSIAETCNHQLNIISCWDCEYEGYLRHHPFAKIPDTDVVKTVMAIESNHRADLQGMIDRSGIGGSYEVHRKRGQPEQIIPAFIDEHNIDILVMGTVGRTGIAGFVIGNTAENVFQKLDCSLLALKPNGFVSPVRAY